MKIRNWSKHQHYKDRAPPWIKLHRDLLNDRQWFELDGEQRGLLVNLWLLAAEDDTGEGNLPGLEDMAFRLRMTQKKLSQLFQGLDHFVEHDASDLLATCYQPASTALATCTPETETEGETETDLLPTADAACEFDFFYGKYPRKIQRKKAETAWKRLSQKDRQAAVTALSAWPFNPDPQFIPHPASWLNGRRWEDEPDKPPPKLVNGHPEPRAAVNAMPVHRAAREDREEVKQRNANNLAKLRAFRGKPMP